jgi:hypothetical protein
MAFTCINSFKIVSPSLTGQESETLFTWKMENISNNTDIWYMIMKALICKKYGADFVPVNPAGTGVRSWSWQK